MPSRQGAVTCNAADVSTVASNAAPLRTAYLLCGAHPTLPAVRQARGPRAMAEDEIITLDSDSEKEEDPQTRAAGPRAMAEDEVITLDSDSEKEEDAAPRRAAAKRPAAAGAEVIVLGSDSEEDAPALRLRAAAKPSARRPRLILDSDSDEENAKPAHGGAGCAAPAHDGRAPQRARTSLPGAYAAAKPLPPAPAHAGQRLPRDLHRFRGGGSAPPPPAGFMPGLLRAPPAGGGGPFAPLLGAGSGGAAAGYDGSQQRMFLDSAGTDADRQYYDAFVDSAAVHSVPGHDSVKFLNTPLVDPRFVPGAQNACHSLADEHNRLRRLLPHLRPYEPLPEYKTVAELEQAVAANFFCCPAVTVPQAAVDAAERHVLWMDHKQRAAFGPGQLLQLPDECLPLYTIGAGLLDLLLPRHNTALGAFSGFLAPKICSHCDRCMASARDDDVATVGEQARVAWQQQPRVRAIHNVDLRPRIMEFQVPAWLEDWRDPRVAVALGGGVSRCVLPLDDPRALRVQILLPPQSLTFASWWLSTQLLHCVLGNGGRCLLNMLHQRILPGGHGWHGEDVVTYANGQLALLRAGRL